MPAQVTTRAQVSGYRLLVRRLEHALIRADSRMIHDPMRGQIRALLVGLVVAILICGGAGVLAFFRPAPNFGDSTIMLSKSNGTLFVRIGDRLHPVLNLASARLIVGKNDPPKQVDDKFLNTVPLGPAVGIVGAPGAIHGPEDAAVSSWAVCDSTQLPSVTEQARASIVETTVLANNPVLGDGIRAASPEQMILTRAGSSTYLVYNGVRAAINPSDPTLYNALHLNDSEVREVSPGLLNSFPLVDPIEPIDIQGAGEPTGYLPDTYRVGAILKAVDSRGDQLYVALHEGLQPISATAADIIRYGNRQSPTAAAPIGISPALVGTAPIVHTLHVDKYPPTPAQFIHADPDRVVCMSWQRNNSTTAATTRMLVGNRLPLPDDAQPVRLATADGGGPGLDTVYLRPGTGEYVRAAGEEPDGQAMGQLFYVDDVGVRFHIADEAAATALGAVGVKAAGNAGEKPKSAPWQVLALLPPGSELSPQAALIAHDGIAADADGSKITPPRG
ncbi:type VII secretion protein EccB [Mycobacterium sp. Aquia_216]|uniref:type VII secretion protein EccB n=1 Tax=Mycobacterium sp. Aquia_216 TaxID=2991729 RepID=UPI00227CC0A6|nr:type VII secretion protein EccB [Mycobacterium sp. Aquia_216]WAJ46378.1 type VII secretion protein EccB [Mycobacterium sp. Aquia_216]